MQFQKILWMMESAPPLSPPSLRSELALSEAKGLSRWAERCFCAQHDNAITHTDAWITLFICIIHSTAHLQIP
jgi:hypothetical protein